MMDSRKGRGRNLGTLAIGAIVGAAATMLALRAFGMIVPLNLIGMPFKKFESAYEALYQAYYRPVSSDTLLNGAVQGMLGALNDPFSDYFPPVGETQFQNTLSNAYVGIGAVVQEVNGFLTIQSVIAKSPAEKAGLKPNDEVLDINGKSIRGMTADAATSLILGPAGKSVQLTVRRPTDPGRLLHFSILRARVTAPEVYPKMLPGHIGYIRLSIVGSNSAEEVRGALTRLRKQGADSLILDLRGNPGGFLDQALGIANLLIPKGKVVVQVQQRFGPPQKTLSSGPGLAMPIAVLMDRGTASAAEILSAALHDDVGAPLVGTRSYGKGTAQTSQTYPDGSGMKYTIAKWLTPTGAWIHHIGLKPSNPVNLPSFASLPTLDQRVLPLHQNQVSASVQTLQKTLLALGYRVDRTDGYYDPSTVHGVQQFQSDNHLNATGAVDQRTAVQLEVKLNMLISKSDTQLSAAEHVVKSLTRRPVSHT